MEVKTINGYDIKDEKARKNKLEHYIIDTADSQEKIQNIFDIDREKIIEFKKGTYNFNNTFNINSNTTILLNQSILNFDVQHAFYNFKDDDEFLEYNGNGNIEIIGGKIVGGCCSFIHGKNIKFIDIDFENGINDHFIELCAINNCLIENCSFNGTIYTDITKELIQFDICTYSAFPHFSNENNPTYDHTPLKNIKINKCNFENNNESYYLNKCIGSHAYELDIYNRNIEITNCNFIDMLNIGIELYNTKNLIVKNNRFIKNSYTDNVEGSMIKFRNSTEDVYIEDNTFSGNVKAIDFALPYLLIKNINVINNTFSNYKYATNPYYIIGIRNCEIFNLKNNIFTDFTQQVLLIGNDNTADRDTNLTISYVENNLFIPRNDISNECINVYRGILYFNNNIIDIENNTFTGNAFIVTGDNSQYKKTCAKGNLFSQVLINNNKGILDKGTDKYKQIYNLKRSIYQGNSTTINNQSVGYPIFNFNTIYLIIGDANNTYTMKIYNIIYGNLLEGNRSYKIPVDNGICTFTINSDGTFSYVGSLALRNVYVINE